MTMPLPRCFSMPSFVVGAALFKVSARNCWPNGGGVRRSGVDQMAVEAQPTVRERPYMDPDWEREFRGRMELFGQATKEGGQPLSIKVRVEAGCFHREHSPEAYRLIDEYLASPDLSDCRFQFDEHESGPEVLVFAAVATAGLTLARSIVELITAIIKARSEGIKRGDRPSAPLELIVRGYSRDGEYFEEKVLRIPPGEVVTPRMVEDAVPKRFRKTPKRKRKEQ